jgi:hypothetical protein
LNTLDMPQRKQNYRRWKGYSRTQKFEL